jgi:hypothetical protein
VTERGQGAFDGVGQFLLLAADGGDVGERGGQRRTPGEFEFVQV